MKEFVVRPLVSTEEQSSWDYPQLPKPPFRFTLVAPSNSGKSVLISYLLGSDELPYKKLFKRNVFVWSPTMKLGSMDAPIEAENIYEEFTPETVEAIMREQAEIIAEFGKKRAPHLCFIMDDVISDLNASNKRILKRLFFSARHSKVSIILASQAYRHIPRPVRVNSSDMAVFETNIQEGRAIGEEQAIDLNQFLTIYEFATKDPYSFLMIRYKNPKERRYQLRLSDQYII